MELKPKFKIEYSKEAIEFLSSLPPQARKKIGFNINKVANGVIDKVVFDKMEGTKDLWEFRTIYANIKYRLLAFWDTESDTIVVAASGFIKKTKKTPSKEIARAEEIKMRYFENKNKK